MKKDNKQSKKDQINDQMEDQDQVQDDQITDEPTQEPETELTELQTLELEIQKYKAGWQRAMADYQNLIKTTAEHRSELVRQSEWQIIGEFLPMYGFFKKAMESKVDADTIKDIEELKKQLANWEKGIGFILTQFTSVLKEHGIQEIKTVGEQFDPEQHDAVKEEESDQPDGTILKEVSPGYLLHQKVVQPAKVVVSKTT